ncbi:MAG: ribonuclease Y [bacterium]|nr:ribonuclease Y [bacterium]
MTQIEISIVVIAVVMGTLIGYAYRRYIAKLKILSAEEMVKKLVDDAKQQAQSLKKEAILEARDELHKERTEFERENRGQRNELQKMEARLLQKEENLDKKVALLEKKEKELQEIKEHLHEKEKEIKIIKQEQREKLEKISGITAKEAKKELIVEMESIAKHEASKMIKQIEDEARATGEKKAKLIISQSIERCAAEHTIESTVSVVSLPSDEMKGRIIGREGRNIRALETLTGIDLIIDDTPEAVLLSGFDPIKREVARISLERLILDGRIHPTRIEEIVAKVQKEMEETLRQEGEKVTFDLGIHGISLEVISLLGRLKFRTSFGQNVLQHSKEVSYLASVMAAELSADIQLVKRAGLLHDIGKSIDSEVEGSHAKIGADIARKNNESTAVVHAISAHHAEEEAKTIEAILIQAADTISAARPGVRRETLESYIKRLTKLEAVATSFPKIEKAYAIQAGREVRVIIQSEETDDAEAAVIARDIAQKIEGELEYPGQIKVTVIRETRIVEYAK